MVEQKIHALEQDELTQLELQHLITVSTGFIDAYIVPRHGHHPMLLPQNIVIAAMDVSTALERVEWHEERLPVLHCHTPDKAQGVALVLDGEQEDQHFAILCDEMPKTVRLRISEMTDVEQQNVDDTVYQYVQVNQDTFQIPNLRRIQAMLRQAA